MLLSNIFLCLITTATAAPLSISTHPAPESRALLALRTDYEAMCGVKNPALVNAIQNFCSNTALTVPSTYATNGVSSSLSFSKNSHTWWTVYITDTCKDMEPQWIPQEYCYSQFYEMCVYGDKHGANTRTFGWGGTSCQEWKIPKLGEVVYPQ